MTNDRSKTAECRMCGRIFAPMVNGRVPVHGPAKRRCPGSKGYPKQHPVQRAPRSRAVARPPEVSIEALQDAIRHLHGCESTFVEAVPVTERAPGGAVAWEGTVNVFDIDGHVGGASRAYTWSFPTTAGKRQFVAVLHAGPITSPLTAVQATILAEAQRRGVAR